MEIFTTNHRGMTCVFVFAVTVVTKAPYSELRHLNRTERRTKGNRWRTDDPTAGIFWLLLATTKLGTKSAFWVPQGLSMHGPDQTRPDQDCRTNSLYWVGVSFLCRTVTGSTLEWGGKLSQLHFQYIFLKMDLKNNCTYGYIYVENKLCLTQAYDILRNSATFLGNAYLLSFESEEDQHYYRGTELEPGGD